jgi:hypothetical protein
MCSILFLINSHPETPTLRKRSSQPMQEEKHNLLINKPSDDAGLLLSCRLAVGNDVSRQTLIN